MTTHEASKEHDLTGLRDNFNPRARWRAAIAGARALHRFGSSASKLSSDSKTSGGWKSIDSSDDDDDDERAVQATPVLQSPGENANVKVTEPPSPDAASQGRPSSGHELKREHEDHEPLHQNVPSELQEVGNATIAQPESSPVVGGNVKRQDTADSDMVLRMPGSFHVHSKEAPSDGHEGWTHLLQKFHIKT